MKTRIRYGVATILMTALLMSAAGVLLYLHDHEDRGRDHDCQNCAICQHLTGDSKYLEMTSLVIIAGQDAARFFWFPAEQIFPASDLLSEHSPRAPPFLG